jgi:excisionase family DNA binding protein
MELMNEKETAAYLNVSRDFMRMSRIRDTGPSYYKVGKCVRYSKADVDAWLESRKVKC